MKLLTAFGESVSRQIGQSGNMATNCKLYTIFGISGAVQHVHGMKHVGTIAAVNSDANAPIFGCHLRGEHGRP